jgi:hypothetical protein
MALLSISFLSISDYIAYAENEIIVNSIGFENSTVLEFKNSRGNNTEIDSVRIWLGDGNSFQSFKTEKGWMGKNTPQGVIIFTTQDSIRPGESVKFGIKTLVEKPSVNWKALDSNGNIIKTAKTVTNTESSDVTNITDVPEVNQPESVGLKDVSTFRLIPDKLSPGSDFRLLGTNFVPNQSLTFYINGNLTKSFSTDNKGNFLLTSKISEQTDPGRTEFSITDSVGAEKEISIRLIESDKRLILKTSEVILANTPSSVIRGDTILLQGTGTPETTLTITTQQSTETISINTITTEPSGEWSFENLFPPDIGLETVTITISDGKSEVSRNIDVISSKKITINSDEPRYEQGDVVTFSGNAIANQNLLVSLEDPKGSEIFSNIITVDPSGIISFDVPISKTSMKGTYILYSNQGDEESITVVGIGEDPVEVIVVNTSKLNYSSNENVVVTIQGMPNASVSLIIIDEASKERLSDSVELGPDGFLIYEFSSDDLSSGAFSIELRQGKARGDTVFTIGLTSGSGPIQMQTTKDNYNPGESILVMGNTGKNSLISVTLHDPDDNILKKVETFSNKEGAFRTDKFRIPNDPLIGEWTVKAKSGGNIADYKITVAAQLENVIVLVDKESLAYSFSEIVNISGAGATEGTALKLEFFDSNGDSISGTLTIYATNTGEYRTSWIIPDDIEPGPVEIRVTSTGNTSSITITVN